MIGTSGGQAYEDELDMHLNRPYEPKQPQTPAARIESGFDALDKDQMDRLIKQFNEQNTPDPSIVIPGQPAPGYFNTGRDVRVSDLDKRTPPPLPILPTFDGLVPFQDPHTHNLLDGLKPLPPLPPGKPGERLGANWQGEGSDMEGPYKPLEEGEEHIFDLKDIRPGWERILGPPAEKDKGYRVKYPKPALTS